MTFDAKSGKTPQPEIAALRQRIRDSQLRQIAGAISNLAQPMTILGLSNEEQKAVVNLVAQRRMQITN